MSVQTRSEYEGQEGAQPVGVSGSQGHQPVAVASGPSGTLPAHRTAHAQLPIETHIGYLKQHTFRVSCSCGWMGMWQREPKHAFSAQARHAGRYM